MRNSANRGTNKRPKRSPPPIRQGRIKRADAGAASRARTVVKGRSWCDRSSRSILIKLGRRSPDRSGARGIEPAARGEQQRDVLNRLLGPKRDVAGSRVG